MRPFFWYCLALSLSTIYSAAFAQEKSARMIPAKKTEVQYDFISVNNILMWLANNGDMAHNPVTDAAGLEWPKGSGKTVVFEDGIIWGGRINGTIRVGGSAYRHGLQPGPLNANGTPVRPPTDPLNRIYRVRKVTIERFNEMSSADQKRLINDYNDWPVRDGAPFTNKDGIAGYQPDFNRWLSGAGDTDEPFMIGDEVLWFVANDMDPSLTSYLYGSPPIGLECQVMLWAYDDPGPLGNVVFTRYLLTNRASDDVTDMYISKWSDPDLGDKDDDLLGVDSTISLAYTYNGSSKDAIYGIPPAIGYDIIQGPVVPSPGDSAISGFRWIHGWKNLPSTSFVFWLIVASSYTDPVGPVRGTTEMYNSQHGNRWNGEPMLNPLTQTPTKFAFSGDPLIGTGWIDGVVIKPMDRSCMLSSGPYTLKKGEGQEIVVATIVGRGSDNLSSIAVLRYYDRYAQFLADNLFVPFYPPPSPLLEAAPADGRIILYWGDPEHAKLAEEWSDRGYRFQGYNVYQYPAATSTLEEAKRLATYDIADNIATIFDEMIDERSGAVVSMPVQFGADSDVRRQISLTRDELTGKPLVNNQPYYFAVTAYAYNPSERAAPRTLESKPVIVEIRPQFPDPGFRNYQLAMDSTINVERLNGIGSGGPVVEVIDPLKLTGDTYEVTFTKLPESAQVLYDDDGDPATPFTIVAQDDVGWNVRNVTTDVAVADTVQWYGGVKNALDIDGFRIGMEGIPHWVPGREISSVRWVGGPEVFPNNTIHSVYNYPWGLARNYLGSGLPDYTVRRSVEIVFDREEKSSGYCYWRGGRPEYGCQGYFESPITVWDVSDPARKRQLSYCFIEQAGSPYGNHEWMPSNNEPWMEVLFVLDEPYRSIPDPRYMNASIMDSMKTWPLLYAARLLQSPEYPQADPRDYRWRDGDKWVIEATRPLSEIDRFRFVTKKWEYSDEVAKKDVEAVNVFPNPYFGDNVQELNRYQRFVTFNHLPPEAVIRIYTLSGTLVRTLQKHDESQIAVWDLLNEGGYPVGSGIYIIHVDMPGLGTQKVLKLSVIMEAQYLDRI